MEVALHNAWELFSDVRVHVEVLIPWLLGRIAVVSGAVANRPVGASGFRAVLIDTSRAGVGHDHGNSPLFARTGVHHLRRRVLVSASQPAAEVDGRVRFAALFLDAILWQEDSKSHVAVVHATPVLHSLHEATATFDSADYTDLNGLFLALMRADVDNASQAGTAVHHFG